jgi:3-hydroxyisobutyrate dehydrogenase-like beta-hydroxyacid dehydrogenase
VTFEETTIGVIGLGQMGGGIAANLARAGYTVAGYDLKPGAKARLVEAGGLPAESSAALVDRCDVVCVSVEGRDAIALFDDLLLPRARPGQILIDHSTVPAPQTRRIGAALLAKGVQYLDAPVSGGAGGAAAGTLRVFVGGDRALAERCWPLFEAIGDPAKIVYCGPIGQGQVAKVVQQLTTRFPDVARMEVMSFGLRAGLDLETVMRALDVPLDSQDPYARLYRAIQAGQTDNLSALFSEWAYFLEEARARGFHMPMLEAMYEFCKDGPQTGRDPLGRPQPSIWNELMRSEERP